MQILYIYIYILAIGDMICLQHLLNYNTWPAVGVSIWVASTNIASPGVPAGNSSTRGTVGLTTLSCTGLDDDAVVDLDSLSTSAIINRLASGVTVGPERAPGLFFKGRLVGIGVANAARDLRRCPAESASSIAWPPIRKLVFKISNLTTHNYNACRIRLPFQSLGNLHSWQDGLKVTQLGYPDFRNP